MHIDWSIFVLQIIQSLSTAETKDNNEVITHLSLAYTLPSKYFAWCTTITTVAKCSLEVIISQLAQHSDNVHKMKDSEVLLILHLPNFITVEAWSPSSNSVCRFYHCTCFCWRQSLCVVEVQQVPTFRPFEVNVFLCVAHVTVTVQHL